MKIEQVYDQSLAHSSYIILSDDKIALIDPARDPQPYYDFAKKNNAEIVAVIETHPHADFISSHAEISKETGAIVYVSKLVVADYPHKTFDEGDEIKLGKITLQAINTPGHSPDSISILLINKEGKIHAVFTGDTLFVGDVGRPDLREKAGKVQALREDLAGQMYESTRNKLLKLPDETLVYPAHGAGSLCGKNISPDLYSTIGKEKRNNYALAEMSKKEFISLLLEDQPFIPKYFGYDVDLNKKGAEPLKDSLNKIPKLTMKVKRDEDVLVVDTRDRRGFEKGHIAGAINIMDGPKFETWLGSVISPDEKFYLIVEDETMMNYFAMKAAKIGYEKNIKGMITGSEENSHSSAIKDLEHFRKHTGDYTIVDIRNHSEMKGKKPFNESIHIPLPELRERINEIPDDKPVMVHCAGGYRSAIGASIIEGNLKEQKVYDLSTDIARFNK